MRKLCSRNQTIVRLTVEQETRSSCLRGMLLRPAEDTPRQPISLAKSLAQLDFLTPSSALDFICGSPILGLSKTLKRTAIRAYGLVFRRHHKASETLRPHTWIAGPTPNMPTALTTL